jgi:histidine phosphotransferase ChpT
MLEEEKDAEMRAMALDLVKKSASNASARLQFCRLAFGAAGSAGAAIDTGDAEKVTRGLIRDGRTELTWSLPRSLMAKNKVKLLLNLCLIALASIPRGGAIEVSSKGEGEEASFRVAFRGTPMRIASTVPALLEGRPDTGIVDAHGIQPFFTGLVARGTGLALTVTVEAEGASILAIPVARTGAATRSEASAA